MKTAKTSEEKSRFPMRIKVGSTTVTIYRVKSPETSSGWLYQVAWNVGGLRHRKSFADLKKARDEAELKANQLASGKVEAASAFTVEDAETLTQARKLCGAVPVLSAIEEWLKARDVCGNELLAAARLWRDTHAADVERVTVSEAVKRFLSSKEKAGVDTGASYEHCLNRLVVTFGMVPIQSVTVTQLQTWLETIAHPVSRNTHRKRIVALFRWCRENSLLPQSAKTEAERTGRAREADLEIGILTVPQWRSILAMIRAQHPDQLAVAVLAGFTGMRRAELHEQKWSDIDLKRGLLRVTKAKRNTPSKRLVHLCPAAIQWLVSCEKTGEPDELVASPWSLDRIRTFCREAKPPIPCPENAFRHSFISYRVAKTGNVAETALEAGNGPAIVHRHYRELVAKQDGKAWFAVTPDNANSKGELIEMAAG